MKKYPKTVATAVWIGRHLLLAKRKDTKTFSGYWEFPGGKVDKGEYDIAEAACREIKEETGLEVEPDQLTLVDGILGDPSTDCCFLFEAWLSGNEELNLGNPEPHKRDKWELVGPKKALNRKLMPGLRKYVKGARKEYSI